MIKFVGLVKRSPGLEPTEFQELLVKRAVPVARTALRGHVQSHVRPSGYSTGEPIADAVIELWFDVRAAPETAALVAAGSLFDGEIFDPARCHVIQATEVLVKDGPRPLRGVKNIEVVHRRTDISVHEFHRYWRYHHEFHRYWRYHHGPLAATIGPVLRYVQSHALVDSQHRPFDGIASTWFENTNAMRESARTVEYAATRADEVNLVAEPLPFLIHRRGDHCGASAAVSDAGLVSWRGVVCRKKVSVTPLGAAPVTEAQTWEVKETCRI